MKACHTLICFVFLMLEDGNTCYFGIIPIYTQEEGKSITVDCFVLDFPGRKLFCKETCENGNILVETTADTAQKGRYSIEYKEQSPYVSITHLKKSDSGHYRCLLTPSPISAPYQDFEIIVTEASTTTPPTSTPGPSPPTTPTLSSTSSSSSEVAVLLAGPQADGSSQVKGSLLVVVVCVPVVVIVLLLPVVLLLIYKRKTAGSGCLKRRRNSDLTKVVLYDNCSPVSTCEDSTYQSLSPASRDQDQTYCTLTEIQHK